MTHTYRIADKNIRIISLYPAVHEYCRDYLTDAEADFTVQTSATDIAWERERSEETQRHLFSDDYLEELAVYRKIAEIMPDYDTFLFHGSVVAVDGEGYLFTAPSGTGKSTHTKLWCRYLGKRAVMVNDDKPLLKVSDSGVTVFGTPYNGKHRRGNNLSVPLKAVCLLERAPDNHIDKITKEEAYPVLLQQAYRPLNAGGLLKTLDLLDRMAQQVTFYRLCCNMDIQAAEMAYHTMKGMEV